MTEDWLGKWAMNQMLINVSTRKFARSMRLPEGDVPAPNGSGLSKSAASRRFVALSAARLKESIGPISDLGLLVIQIDGIHMDEDMTLVAAIGIDVNGDKHPLGPVEGATENAATVQALIDNLVERSLDPTVPRLFIIEGSKALSKAIRATFGRDAAIQRCQIHKARNIMDRLPKSMHAQVRRVLRQEGCVGSQSATPASRFSTSSGTSPDSYIFPAKRAPSLPPVARVYCRHRGTLEGRERCPDWRDSALLGGTPPVGWGGTTGG